MPLKYIECFGEKPESEGFGNIFKKKDCPFVEGACTKRFSSGITSGACVLALESDGFPVVCCPKRMYGQEYKILRDVIEFAFGTSMPLVLEDQEIPVGTEFVVPLGQRQGKEIRIPFQESKGGSKFSVDWILARVSAERKLIEFVAIEVQTIDTTGNYQHQFFEIAEKYDPDAIANQQPPIRKSSSFNFENVNKRILPQLITKGHILRREELCKRGLFFVCPIRVFERILNRIGQLPDYPVQTGSVTIVGYDLDYSGDCSRGILQIAQRLTTTSEQLSLAFSSPKTLPAAGVYEGAIRDALNDRFSK